MLHSIPLRLPSTSLVTSWAPKLARQSRTTEIAVLQTLCTLLSRDQVANPIPFFLHMRVRSLSSCISFLAFLISGFFPSSNGYRRRSSCHALPSQPSALSCRRCLPRQRSCNCTRRCNKSICRFFESRGSKVAESRCTHKPARASRDAFPSPSRDGFPSGWCPPADSTTYLSWRFLLELKLPHILTMLRLIFRMIFSLSSVLPEELFLVVLTKRKLLLLCMFF